MIARNAPRMAGLINQASKALSAGKGSRCNSTFVRVDNARRAVELQESRVLRLTVQRA